MEESRDFPIMRAGRVSYTAGEPLERAGAARHFFLFRTGGESSGKFESLNLSISVGDSRECVERNRARVREELGMPRPAVRVRQVHGETIVKVDERNLESLAADPIEADAMITALRGVPLEILVADCVPVIVCDARTPALAVVHAGWRGTARKIVWKAILMMIEQFGTRSEDCTAAIGPAIAAGCYEVGEDVREIFLKGLPDGEDVLSPGRAGRWHADLRKANYHQLLDGRIPPDRAAVCSYCTHCEADRFFSARREPGGTGRQPAIAWLT